ncbi:MAG: hypothetical protein IJW51_04985 [Clostridia bacterium]|nr:hypothetical protein [Clostridia bacterium]
MEFKELIRFCSSRLHFGGSYQNDKNRQEVLRYIDVTEAAYESFFSALLATGLTLYSENCIVGNRFATLITTEHEVHLCFYPTVGEMRVIYGARGYLPSLEAPRVENGCSVTVTQMALVGEGQSNVIMLADGSFLIIDGGKKDDTDRDALLDFLLAHKPTHHEKPRIAAWLISHAHNDHIHLCQEFLLDYGEQVELLLFGYNFPDFETDIIQSETEKRQVLWQARMKEILDAHFPDTVRWTMHTGQKLLLPGCEAEFLTTWEDYWPQTMKTVNQTSFCMRLRFAEGKTLMLPCDAWTGMGDHMATVFGSYLKSDVLQATHHGLAGGSIPFYEHVAPEVVLWSTPKERFEATEPIPIPGREKPMAIIRQFAPSRWLIEHAARHYTHAYTVTIDMKDLTEIT